MLVASAATLISGLLLLGTTGIGFVDWATRTFDWRDQEYAKLKLLHAGYTRARFESVLGEPVFDRESRNGRYREQTYRRREYWVQTISDQAGTVVVYAVTACGQEFRPSFQIPGVSANGPGAHVELNASQLGSVLPEQYVVNLDYFGSGATANSRFHDIFYGGNPGNYKTFVWGVNDVCFDWFDQVYPSILKQAKLPPREVAIFRGSSESGPAWAKRLRKGVTVNTYAETEPLFELRRLRGIFQVGADRILTRTTDSNAG